MATQTVSVPDIGGTEGAEVIEVSVAVGDVIEKEQAIIVLETDKASMDIPSPMAGKVTAVNVKEGDKVSEGNPLIELDTEDNSNGGAEDVDSTSDVSSSSETESEASETESETSEQPAQEANKSASSSKREVTVPDGAEDADVTEILVAEGDEVAEGDSLIVLETDKASMEVPSPAAGKVVSIALKEGEKTVSGGLILTLEVGEDVKSSDSKKEKPSESTLVDNASPTPADSKPSEVTVADEPIPNKATPNEASVVAASQSKDVYAGPAVRKFAREMAVDLTQVSGTGERGRVTRDDVKTYVKQVMTGQKAAPAAGSATGGIPAIPAVDFSQFGEIEMQPMSKVKKLTAQNMSRNWLNVPHVTQFDDADITELEAFRQSLKPEAEKRGVKLTPLPFLLKACAAALVAEPSFNVSLYHDGEHIVQKKYINIGIAVDSPIGLVVPVMRDVDKKGLWELATEFMEIIGKARDGKLGPKDMQGGCFTISSLGAMGGQGFTPIVNAPEVAILGVSKSEMKPRWNGKEFEPRNMLPLSLSYDHRAINGGDAGRFFTYLNSVIADIRRMLL